MGYQVRLQKAGLGLLPLRECADGDLLLEHGASSRCGEATLASFALGMQETIGCSCAHGKQLAPALLSKVEMLMPLQRFDQRGEKGNEAFGADAVSGVPDQKQRMLDVWPILSRTGASKCLLHLFGMIEQPPGVSTMVASCCHKAIQ